jgi:archaellum component FlaC
LASAETDEVVGACPYHATQLFRQQRLEDRVKDLEQCFAEVKRDINEIKTKQALISQQIKNLLWPILIVLGAVLVEVGKGILNLAQNGTGV